MSEQLFIPKNKRRYIFWIIIGAFVIIIPIYYYILNSQFSEEKLKAGLLRVVENNYPFLSIDMSNPSFRINSKLKYDFDRIIVMPKAGSQIDIPFKKIIFTNVKIRVPLLFVLGGRRIDIAADIVDIEGIDLNNRTAINGFFSVPTLQMRFPALVRNNKFNANFNSIELGIEQIGLRNVIFRDINLKKSMAMEATLNGELARWQKNPWELHLTGEFKLLEILRSASSDYKFFAKVTKFPLPYVNNTSWEMMPSAKNLAKTQDDGDSSFQLQIRQKGVDGSFGFSGNLSISNNLQIETLSLKNHGLKKKDLQSYFTFPFDHFHKQLGQDEAFVADVAINFKKNSSGPSFIFNLKNESTNKTLYLGRSVKTLSSEEKNPSEKFVHEFNYEVEDRRIEESYVFHNDFPPTGRLLSQGSVIDFKSDQEIVIEDNGKYSIITLFEKYLDELKKTGQNSDNLDYKLKINNFLVGASKNSLLLNSSRSPEGIVSTDLKLLDAQTNQPVVSGNYIYKTKTDGVVIVAKFFKVDGGILSKLLFMDKVLLTGVTNGQIVLQKENGEWSHWIAKLSIAQGKLLVGNLLEIVRPLITPEKFEDLESAMSASTTELSGEWSTESGSIQLIITDKNKIKSKKPAKSWYFQLEKTKESNIAIVKIFDIRPTKLKSLPLATLKISLDGLNSNQWDFSSY
jgi:hypothetical protein